MSAAAKNKENKELGITRDKETAFINLLLVRSSEVAFSYDTIYIKLPKLSKTLRCKLKIRQTLGSDARADTEQLSDLNWLKFQPRHGYSHASHGPGIGDISKHFLTC